MPHSPANVATASKKNLIRDVLCCVFLLTISAVVFAQSVGFDFVSYDDPALVTGNGYVNQGFSWVTIKWAFFYIPGGREIIHSGTTNLWHPLTWLSHTLDSTLFGIKNAAGHHLTSYLLHSLSGLTLYAIARKLSIGVVASGFTAACFLIHPLHVEPVAWVSSRKDVLCGLWIHLSLLLGMQRRMRIATLFFVAALLSKPLAVITPLLLLLLWNWPKPQATTSLQSLRAQIFSLKVWFILAALGAGATLYFQGTGSHADFMSALPLTQRLLTMASGFCFLLLRSIWPFALSFHYPYPLFGTLIHTASWFVVVIMLIGLYKFCKKLPLVVWAMLWFTICWLPISGLAYVGTSFTTDRYAYLSLTGIFLALGYGLAFSKQLKPSLHYAAISIACIILLVFCGLAWKQTQVWKNSQSLFQHATRAQPRDTVAMSNLAALYQQQNQFQEAITLHRKAREAGGNLHISFLNEGNCYLALKQTSQAEQSFRSSVKAYPAYTPAWMSLGQLMGSSGKHHEALLAFQQAWQSSRHSHAHALLFLIQSHFVLGEYQQARELLPTLRSYAAKDPIIQQKMKQWISAGFLTQ